MSRQYISTFITGFQSQIPTVLKNNFANPKINLLLDGLVVYETETSIEKIKKANFLNNTFLYIRDFKVDKKKPLEIMALEIIRSKRLNLDITIPNKFKSFRVIFSYENQMTPVDSKLLIDIEKKITKQTRLKVDKSTPDVEFWIIYRSEGYGFFGMRLTKHPDYIKTLPKGALRPELSSLLVLMSEPGENDVFLDPFAGFGSIPKSRILEGNYKKVYLSDNDNLHARKLKKAFAEYENCTVYNLDVINLANHFGKRKIDKIVTDPPWGHYQDKNFNLYKFYTTMMDNFYEVLRKYPGKFLCAGL